MRWVEGAALPRREMRFECSVPCASGVASWTGSRFIENFRHVSPTTCHHCCDFIEDLVCRGDFIERELCGGSSVRGCFIF